MHSELIVQTAIFVLPRFGLLVVFAAVLFGAGRHVLRRFEFGHTLEEISFSTALGLGLYGTLVFVLGLFRLIYWQTILGLLIVLLVVSLQTWRNTAERLSKTWRSMIIPTSLGRWALFIVGVCMAGLILWPVLAKPFYPPTQWDAISYHLAVAKSYASSHSVEPLPHLRFCVFPQLMNMLFTSMLLLQDDIAAQLVSVLTLVLTALAVLGWGTRRFSFRTGILGTALLLTSPMILFLGSTAYIDMGLTMFITLAIFAFLNWSESRRGEWVVLAGALTGFASGVKYTGAFVALAFLIVLIAQVWRPRRWKLVGGFLLAVLLSGGPWYARNVIYTHDPFFPMLSRTVPNPCWNAADAQVQRGDLAQHGTGRTFVSFLKLPWDLTFHQEKFFQDFGNSASRGIFVLLPLSIWFAVISPLARRLMVTVLAYTIFWFVFAPLLRYLQPIVPLWSLATAAAVDRLAGKVRLRPAGLLLIAAAAGGLLLWQSREQYSFRYNRLPVTDVQRDIYLGRFPSYPCFEWLNRHQGEDYRVYSLGEEYMGYFADGVRLGDVVGPGRYADLDLTSAKGLHGSLRRLRVDYLMESRSDQLAPLQTDPHFSRYFRVVCGNAYARLWLLTDERTESIQGPNVMLNPGLEEVQDMMPSQWSKVGIPRLDTSGRESREGSTAFMADRQNYFFPTVELAGDQLYEVRFWARAEEGPAEVRLQFHWRGIEGAELGASTQLFPVGSEWTEMILPLTTPPGTAQVVLYPHASEAPVWFDDFSMRPVLQTGLAANRRPAVYSTPRGERSEDADILSLTVHDPDGAEDIVWVELIVGVALRAEGTCYLRWSGGELSLQADNGVDVAGRLLPGGESALENSSCRVQGSKLVARIEGADLFLDIPVELKDRALKPQTYARAQDQTGATFFWEPVSGEGFSGTSGGVD